MKESFSKRHGFQPNEKQITVRHDAPHALRGVLIDIAYDAGFSPKDLRPVVCRTLRKRSDPNNWSEYPNIDNEIHSLLDDCEWYQVYDVIEEIYRVASQSMYGEAANKFEEEINSYFRIEGIGWRLRAGKIEVRGEEGFESSVRNAYSVIEQSGLNTASNEMHEALTDLSRRPKPDVTGAIQHSMAALECVAREICGDRKAAIGDILKKFSSLIPKPLDHGIKKRGVLLLKWDAIYGKDASQHLRKPS